MAQYLIREFPNHAAEFAAICATDPQFAGICADFNEISTELAKSQLEDIAALPEVLSGHNRSLQALRKEVDGYLKHYAPQVHDI
ncbi:MAG: hypothetical protein ACR2O8_00430 [Rhizobiaceae bacterium]